MNFKNIILSKESQTQKGACCMISFLSHSRVKGCLCLVGGYLSTDLWTLADHLLLACERSERPQKKLNVREGISLVGAMLLFPLPYLMEEGWGSLSFLTSWAARGHWNPGYVTPQVWQMVSDPMRESKGHQAGWYGLYCRPKGRLQLAPGNLHSGRHHACARQGRWDTTVPGTSRWGSPVELCPPKLKLSTPW